MLTICLALWLAEASAAATRSPSAKSIVRYYDDGSIEATYSIE